MAFAPSDSTMHAPPTSQMFASNNGFSGLVWSARNSDDIDILFRSSNICLCAPLRGRCVTFGAWGIGRGLETFLENEAAPTSCFAGDDHAIGFLGPLVEVLANHRR